MPSIPRAFWSNGQRLLDFGQGPVPADAPAMHRARQLVPNLTPIPLGLAASFGFGDRIGLATPGHVHALLRKTKAGAIKPIFPQQSIREMTRTSRTPQQVMDEALFGVLEANSQGADYSGPIGADADHLKTDADVERTAAAGFCFFTIDPSDDVDANADTYSEPQLREKFAAARGAAPWFDKYKNKTIMLPSGLAIPLSEQACMRAAVKYGLAIQRALRLAQHIDKTMREKTHIAHTSAPGETSPTASAGSYEIELSVDETPQPTTLQEHYIIADQCLRGGMKLVSLAPRYIGDFEKGVDYKGDLAAFEKSLANHAAIAALLGSPGAAEPYKLSLHSGSDKLSIYAAFARLTKGRFHVKTAGTSYLEALRVVAHHEPALFADLIAFARTRYDTDKKTYHVSATVEAVPAPDSNNQSDLEALYLERWKDVPPNTGFTAPGRQILHCTFGSTLTHPTFGPAIRQTLLAHPETYAQVLAEHFAKHLDALTSGM